MNNLVTVIIPSYNQGKFIAKSIQSCLDQTYLDLEIIIIDDGSTDDTAQVVKKIIQKNPGRDIKYVLKKNSGPSESRNNGIKMAKGKYIQFLDGDDYLGKNKIKLQVDFLDKNNQIDIVYGSFRYENLDKKSPKLKDFVIDLSANTNNLETVLKTGGLMPIQCFLVRKYVFTKSGMFNPKRGALEDLDLWIRCIQKEAKFFFLEDFKQSVYVLKNVSLSRDKRKMYLNFAIILEELVKSGVNSEQKAIISSKLVDVYMFLSIIESIRRDYSARDKYYRLMLKESSSIVSTKIKYLIHKMAYFLLKRKDILSYEK